MHHFDRFRTYSSAPLIPKNTIFPRSVSTEKNTRYSFLDLKLKGRKQIFKFQFAFLHSFHTIRNGTQQNNSHTTSQHEYRSNTRFSRSSATLHIFITSFPSPHLQSNSHSTDLTISNTALHPQSPQIITASTIHLLYQPHQTPPHHLPPQTTPTDRTKHNTPLHHTPARTKIAIGCTLFSSPPYSPLIITQAMIRTRNKFSNFHGFSSVLIRTNRKFSFFLWVSLCVDKDKTIFFFKSLSFPMWSCVMIRNHKILISSYVPLFNNKEHVYPYHFLSSLV